MAEVVSRGLEQMQNNAEDFISMAPCNAPTFSLLDCLGHRLFEGELRVGRASTAGSGHLQFMVT